MIRINKYLYQTLERFEKQFQIFNWKSKFKKNIYKYYFIYNNLSIVSKKNEPKAFQADVLIPFFPYREDYELFIYPVIENLIKKQKKVLLIVPKKASKSDRLNKINNNVKILYYEDLMTQAQIWSSAHKNYKCQFRDYKKENFNFNPYLVERILIEYSFDYAIAKKVLELYNPKIIFSIHFVLNPGWITVIKEKGIPIHLIQHGFFNTELHDFKHSDLVYLWGFLHKNQLEKLDSNLNSIVVGNPKLEFIQKTKRKQNENFRVLIVSSGDTFQEEEKTKIIYDVIELMKNKNLDVKYKLRPGEKINSYKRWIDANLLKNEDFLVNEDTYDLIMDSYIVIGTVSTIVNETAFLQKVAIRINYDEEVSHINDGIKKITSAHELESIIEDLLCKDVYNNFLIEQNKYLNDFFLRSENIAGKISDEIIKNRK